VATASSLVKEARGSIMGASRACTNRRGGENKCGNNMPKPMDRIYTLTRLICYGYR